MNHRDEERLLHEICRNSGIGMDAIEEVLKDVYDEEFAYELHAEAGKMKEFEQKAAKRLQEDGKEASDVRPMTQRMMKAAVKMKTALSYDTSHVADIMQKGNQRGINELKKAIHKYKDAGIYATELAKEMVDFEEENLKRLDGFQKKKK